MMPSFEPQIGGAKFELAFDLGPGRITGLCRCDVVDSVVRGGSTHCFSSLVFRNQSISSLVSRSQSMKQTYI